LDARGTVTGWRIITSTQHGPGDKYGIPKIILSVEWKENDDKW